MFMFAEVVLTWFGWLVGWMTAHIQEIGRVISSERTSQPILAVSVVRPQVEDSPNLEANLVGNETDQSKEGMDEQSASTATAARSLGAEQRESKSVDAADDKIEKDNSKSQTDAEFPGVLLEETAPEKLNGSPNAHHRLSTPVFGGMFKHQVDTVADKHLDHASCTVATSECQSSSEEEDDVLSSITVNSSVTCSTDGDNISEEFVGLTCTIEAQPEPTKLSSARIQQSQERSAEQQVTTLRPRGVDTAQDRPYMLSTGLSRARATKILMELTFDSKGTILVSEEWGSDDLFKPGDTVPLNDDMLVLVEDDMSDACNTASNMSDREGVPIVTECELASEISAGVVAATDDAVASNTGWGVRRSLVPCLVYLVVLLLICRGTGVPPDRIGATLSDANCIEMAAPATAHVLSTTSRTKTRGVSALSAFDDVVELSMILAAS